MGNVTTSVKEKGSKASTVTYGALIDQKLPDKELYRFPEWKGRLPRRVDLRQGAPRNNPGCSPYFEAFSQETSGTCTSQAAAAAFMCAQRRQKTPSARLIEPSVLFNYYYARYIHGDVHYDSGTTVHAALTAMKEGVSPENVWPYHADNINKVPPTLAQKDALFHSALTIKPLVPGLVNLKTANANGIPFMFSFTVTPELDAWFKSPAKQRNSAYMLNVGHVSNENKIGAHTVLCVGYDDGFQGVGAFICRNSWGPQWGDNGHFYINYEIMVYPAFAHDFHVLETVCSNPKQRCVNPSQCNVHYASDVC